MKTLTIRIPDEKHNRLKHLAESQGISINKLMEELSTIALTEFDTQNRFKQLASQGDRQVGLALLNKLDNR
jgi:glycine cleavage system pyridoxal-binding protein P